MKSRTAPVGTGAPPVHPPRKGRSADSLPLAGLRILVGRARHQASALSAGLRKLGAQVVEIPFIEIRKPPTFHPLDHALKNLHHYDWLILTSVNGVEAMWQRVRKLHLTKKHWQHLRIAAIGPATKKAIEKRGMKVEVVPEEYVAEFVVRSLRVRVKGKRVLLVRAKVARDVIPRELRAAGAHVEVVEGYETVVPQSSRHRLRAALKGPQPPDFITFTSSSTVRNFVALLGANSATARGRGPALGPPKRRPRRTGLLEGVKLASIGPVTSATLRQLKLPVDVEAREYTIPGLIRAIVTAQKT